MDKTTSKINIKANLFYSTIIKILTFLLPLIVAPYLSRVLGPTGIGNYTYVYSIISYFLLFISFGFGGFGTLVISTNRNNKDEYSVHFWSIIVARLIFLFISVFIFSFLFLFAFDGFNNDNALIFLIMSPILLSSFLDITFLFQGLEMFKHISLMNLFIRAISTISIFLFVRSRSDLYIYAMVQTLQIVLIAFLPWLFISRYISKPSFSKSKIIYAIRKSIHYFIPSLAVTLCSLIDKTMLGALKGFEEVGYYEQADKIIIIVVNVLHAFAAVFAPRVSYLIANNKEKEASSKISDMFELYFVVGIPCVFGLYLIGKVFIPTFFGIEFYPALFSFYFLIPLILFSSISNALGNVFYSPRGKIWMTSVFYTIGSSINILLNVFLIERNGALGASISSFISELIIVVLFIIFSNRNIHFSIVAKQMIKPLFSSIVMFVFLFILNGFIVSSIGNGLALVLLDILLGICCYFALCILLKERIVWNTITKILKKRTENI